MPEESLALSDVVVQGIRVAAAKLCTKSPQEWAEGIYDTIWKLDVMVSTNTQANISQRRFDCFFKNTFTVKLIFQAHTVPL